MMTRNWFHYRADIKVPGEVLPEKLTVAQLVKKFPEFRAGMCDTPTF
jgi:hypothetical protein